MEFTSSSGGRGADPGGRDRRRVSNVAPAGCVPFAVRLHRSVAAWNGKESLAQYALVRVAGP